MNNKIKQIAGWVITLLVLFTGCGGNSENGSTQSSESKSTDRLTEFEQKHGIGPVNEPVTFDEEINSKMVVRGKEIFKTKCSACHKMTEGYVGPPLGDVLEKRTPAYVMNMILNPVEMTRKHPEAKKLLRQYMNQMTFQNVSREQARAIVEFLRTQKSEQKDISK